MYPCIPGQTGGKEQFIVVDFISVMEEKFVLVIDNWSKEILSRASDEAVFDGNERYER